jgi:hypothetical protein
MAGNNTTFNSIGGHAAGNTGSRSYAEIMEGYQNAGSQEYVGETTSGEVRPQRSIPRVVSGPREPEYAGETAPSTKDTNPKDAVGIRKVPGHVIPQRVVAETGLALLEGARKYGSYNWREAGVRASVYYDAVVTRHLGAWWEGQDTDPDSGLSHVTKAIAGLMVLRDSMMHGNWTDDRPIAVDDSWVHTMNEKAAEIIERYPISKPPFTEKPLDA